MSSWKGLVKLAGEFDSINARLIGISADSPEVLSAMRKKRKISFSLLSDPDLITADLLGVQISRKHPKARSYPKKAFLQPALFVWSQNGDLAHQWIQTAKITTLYGASNRPSPDEILKIFSRVIYNNVR